MAASQPTDYTPGDMPIAEQTQTYHWVMRLFKWGSLVSAAGLAMLTLWFCTPAGPIPGIVVALIILVLGVVFLRDKSKPAH